MLYNAQGKRIVDIVGKFTSVNLQQWKAKTFVGQVITELVFFSFFISFLFHLEFMNILAFFFNFFENPFSNI